MLYGEGLFLRPIFQQKLLGIRCGEADSGGRKEGIGDLVEFLTCKQKTSSCTLC